MTIVVLGTFKKSESETSSDISVLFIVINSAQMINQPTLNIHRENLE